MRVDPRVAACAAGFALAPLFPSLITLTTVTIPGVSLMSHDWTVALLATCAAFGAFLLAAVALTRGAPVPTLVPLSAWLCAGLLAAALGFAPSAGLLFLGIFGLSLVWHTAIVKFCRGSNETLVLYWAIGVSSFGASAAAITMALLRRPPALYAIAHGRAVGSFVLPGELAGYLIVLLPLLFALARRVPQAPLRVLCIAASIAGLAAFVMTFSRAGWVGLAAAAACYGVWSGALPRRYAPLIVAAGIVAVLALFNVRHNPAENYTRLSIWQAALAIVRRFPLTGVGPFDFARIYPLVRVPGGDEQAFHAHDVILTMFAETGIVGVAAMLWAWITFAKELRRRVRTATLADAEIALAIAAGLAGTWVQGLIDTVSVVIFGLWLPAMALALAVAAPARESS